MKRTGFSLEQHQDLGEELKQARLALMRASEAVCKAYGPSSQEYKRSRVALLKLESLKSVLDDAVAREQPHVEHLVFAECYYGPTRAERA